MLNALEAFGPERVRVCSPDWHDVCFGHRLRAMTVEDAFDEQPAAVAGELLFVAEARVDNRAELAQRLELSSLELAGTADTGLLLAAWRRWGVECLEHLAGGFAFAVWEPRKQRLFLARDHSGERNLYYRHTPDGILFATTARAIRACPGVSPELDEATLARDLAGLPPEYPRSRFREIRQIAPGHCVVAERGTLVHRRYWQIHELPPVRFARDEDYAERFAEILDEAVRARLRTTGGVASELSAGLDSSAVTSSAARLLALEGRGLTAYTAVPCGEVCSSPVAGVLRDEGPAAAEVARMYPNIRHELVDSTGSDMLREFERTFPYLDLPHAAGLNAVWSNLIYERAAASGVKIVLSGALGNFALSYSGADILYGLFRQGGWGRTLQMAGALRTMGISSGRNAASQTIFAALPWALRRRLDPLVRGMDLAWSPLRADRAREFGMLDQARRFLFEHTSALPRLMDTQFQCNQYGDYNAAAMAGWGIEVRDPTADRRVFEFCAAIPQKQYVVGGQGRSLIRRAMRGRLPESTRNRTARGFQASDWYDSLTRIRARLAVELSRIAESPGARRLLDLEMLRGALESWPADAAAANRNIGLYQSAVSRGVGAGYFIRRVEEESFAQGARLAPDSVVTPDGLVP
jgi:asparagine synthase (glutamine-hydrolysing)